VRGKGLRRSISFPRERETAALSLFRPWLRIWMRIFSDLVYGRACSWTSTREIFPAATATSTGAIGS
jgi:hypothetical protein